jgi:DNA-directed RNA polymerase specialized sigma24 family protein
MQWDGIHALLQRAKGGDEAAWQRLHDMARPYLLQVAQRYLGADWPQQSLSDLIQDTWVRAWQGIGGFDGGAGDEQTAPISAPGWGRS